MAGHDCARRDPYRKGPPVSANCVALGAKMVGNDGRTYQTVGGQASSGKSYQRWSALPGEGKSSMPSRPKSAAAKAKAAPKAKPKPKPKPKAKPKARPKPKPKAKPKPKPKAKPRARTKRRTRA